MSETAYIDELLKAEQSANEIISNAQRERSPIPHVGSASSRKPRRPPSRKSTSIASRRTTSSRLSAKGYAHHHHSEGGQRIRGVSGEGDRSGDHPDRERFRQQQRQGNRDAGGQGPGGRPEHPQLRQREVCQEEMSAYSLDSV